jgi:peptide/nickel transport system permease protein
MGGLFSPEFENARWSLPRLWDFLRHAWAPVLVLATAGTAELIRILRANLLDELKKPYVVTARAKGLPEWKVILKYPVRLAMNPLVSTIGWLLPALVSGSVIVSVVLNLPTAGPMLLRSLTTQDMYLAGAIILLLSVLTVIGTVISDILLALIDPRIRYGSK